MIHVAGRADWGFRGLAIYLAATSAWASLVLCAFFARDEHRLLSPREAAFVMAAVTAAMFALILPLSLVPSAFRLGWRTAWRRHLDLGCFLSQAYALLAPEWKIATRSMTEMPSVRGGPLPTLASFLEVARGYPWLAALACALVAGGVYAVVATLLSGQASVLDGALSQFLSASAVALAISTWVLLSCSVVHFLVLRRHLRGRSLGYAGFQALDLESRVAIIKGTLPAASRPDLQGH